jgi:hypothetical protein
MFRTLWIAVATLAVMTAALGQEKRTRIDVEKYLVRAEINPHTQSVSAAAQVTFTSLDDRAVSAIFELNNALTVSKVTDEQGREIPTTRQPQENAIRLNFPESLIKSKPVTVTFHYEGRLTGNEESPIYGIKFAAIHNDYSFLMYPSRWFPISGYTTDRYTAEFRITVPVGMRVIGSGVETTERPDAGKVVYIFRSSQPTFPGSIAVVNDEPARVSSQGATTALYFRGAERGMATAYGEEIGKVLTFLAGAYGIPTQASLSVVETEDGAPNGYSAPGVIFLAPKTIGKQVNTRVLANQIARQWWGVLVSPTTRNHMWFVNGMARYSEILYLEHVNGPSALANEAHDAYVDALTVDNPALIQASRLEDYSPEYWALTGSKGAVVLHMLRWVVGDDKFTKILRTITDQYAWKSMNTEDFQKASESISGLNMKGFFIQWIESTGAPEFKLEYTVFRTQKGFRIMGKVTQDLDTFRMPVDLKIETEGNPEEKRVDVVGTSSEFSLETFGKPKKVILDAGNHVLRFSNPMRVAVAIRRGEQFTEISEFNEGLKEYQKAIDVNRSSSLAHFRVAELFFYQNNYQSAANEFREALNGDLDPKWIEVWAHINLGKIFDITGQRERAVNAYQQAIRTKDNTQNAQEEAAKYLKKPYERPKQNN